MAATDKRQRIVDAIKTRVKAELEKGGKTFTEFDGVSALRKEILPTIAVVELGEKSDRHGRRAYLRTITIQIEVAVIETDRTKSFETGRDLLKGIRDGIEIDDNLSGVAVNCEESINEIETVYDPMVVVAVQYLVQYCEKFPMNG